MLFWVVPVSAWLQGKEGRTPQILRRSMPTMSSVFKLGSTRRSHVGPWATPGRQQKTQQTSEDTLHRVLRYVWQEGVETTKLPQAMPVLGESSMFCFCCVAFVLLSLMCVLACCFVVSRVLLCVLCCCVVSCCLVCVCVCVCFLCFALFKPVGRDMFSFFARVGLSERAHRAISR